MSSLCAYKKKMRRPTSRPALVCSVSNPQRLFWRCGPVEIRPPIYTVGPGIYLDLVHNVAIEIEFGGLCLLILPPQCSVAVAGVDATISGQQVGTTQGRGVRTKVALGLDSDRPGWLVYKQYHTPAVSTTTLLNSQIAVVEGSENTQSELPNPARLKSRVVLMREPGKNVWIAASRLRWICDGEVTKRSHPPKNTAISLAILVIHISTQS